MARRTRVTPTVRALIRQCATEALIPAAARRVTEPALVGATGPVIVPAIARVIVPATGRAIVPATGQVIVADPAPARETWTAAAPAVQVPARAT